jgi:membrane-associated phospholipid phosphatase
MTDLHGPRSDASAIDSALVPLTAAPSVELPTTNRLRTKQLGWMAWLAVTAFILVRYGVPTSRPPIFILIVLALGVASIGEPGGWRRVLRDWAPFLLILTVYDALRGEVANLGSVHVLPQISFDRWLFGGQVLTVRLQHLLYTPGRPHWWDFLSFFVYLSYFFAAVTIAAVLWRTNHPRFQRFVFLLLLLTFAAFVTYALYPAAPPWLASRSPHTLAPTAKIVDEMWSHIGLQKGASLLSATSRLANPVAAIPSLHSGYTMLIVLFFWRSLRPRGRVLLALYPFAMGFALVYTGEHYVIDVLLGWLYAGVVYVAGNRMADAWTMQRSESRLELPLHA